MKKGDTSALETLVSAKDFSDLVNKAEYVQNVHSYDRKMLEEYVATKQRVQDLKSTLETEMNNLEDMQAEFESDKENLDTTLASKQEELGSLDGRQAAAEKAAEEQRRQEEAQQANNNGNNNNNNNNGNKKAERRWRRKQSFLCRTGKYRSSPEDRAGGVQPDWRAICMGRGQALCRTRLFRTCAVLPCGCGNLTAALFRVPVCRRKKSFSPEPGDICWKPGHVGIYIGGGMMIEAQQTGTNIMISPVRAQGYARYW